MKKPGGKRNRGFGRSVRYAIRNALRDKYGDGRYETRHTYETKLRKFETFLTTHGINDLNKLESHHILEYARDLRMKVETGLLAVSTAVNHLSAVNNLVEHMFKHRRFWLSPREHIGSRSYVCKVPPIAMVIESFEQLNVAEVRSRIHGDALVVLLGLCRFAGMRFREASLAGLSATRSRLRSNDDINVTEGTKGGRRADRFVPSNPGLVATLTFSNHRIDRRCVIPDHMDYITWSRFAYRNMPAVAEILCLSTRFHDLRKAYACRRYAEITGFDAPVVAGQRVAEKGCDQKARLILGHELGHNRPQIACSYVGSAR